MAGVDKALLSYKKELEESGLNIFHDMIRIANQPTQEDLDNIYNSIIEKL